MGVQTIETSAGSDVKIVHVTPAFYPATYWGGPIYSVYGLCNALANINAVTLRVVTTDSAGPSRSDAVEVSAFPMRYAGGYDVFFCRRWWAASVSPSMFLRLWPMIRWADVVHLTGVYSPPTIPTLLICRLLGKPVVWSPRGALQRWEGTTKPLFKKAWEWICNALIKPGRCILHVTSKHEAAVSVARISKAVAELVPNGVDIPEALPDRVWLPDGKLRLLYLGRLHPIKGIENLLRALTTLDDGSVSLAICGSGDEAYSLGLRQMVRELGLERCVSFQGHVNGEEKKNVFMQADVCVVPSFTENFGMVVAEALAHAVPVVASRGTPWAEVEKHGCGLWVENTPESLAVALGEIKSRDLAEMGKRGRAWMARQFSWDSVANRMLNLYERLASGVI